MPVRTRRKTARWFAVSALAISLAVAGCATHHHVSDQSGAARTTTGDFPVTITPPGGQPVTLDKRPERIISLSPAGTEILFAVGAGPQIVAVDRQSDYPADAPHSTIDAIQPNIEAIASYRPDLLIASNDPGGLMTGMTTIKVPVLMMPAPANLDDAYTEWTLIGKATGHADQAVDLVRHSKEDIAKIVHDTPKPNRPLSYYHEIDQSLYTATSRTFIGNVYSLFGLRDIADAADSSSAVGYPRLSAEQVIKADPDLIFLADGVCCGQNPGTVSARPGWSTLTAVRTGNIVTLDDAQASRWGPRIVDLIRTVSGGITKAVRQM